MTELALAAAIAVTSTAYCLSGRMADGTHVRAGSVAHNGHALGTRLTISPSPTGARRFVVRDRIGWGTELDFWVPSCAQAIAWGRRTVYITVGWARGYGLGRLRPTGFLRGYSPPVEARGYSRLLALGWRN